MSQKENVYKANSYLYVQDDEESTIFIVKSGEVSFSCYNEEFKRNRKNAKPGDIFGFISALSNRPRTESAIAVTDAKVLELSKDTFFSLLQKNSEIAIKIINYFAEELRALDNLIISNRDTDIEPYNQKLFNLGKHFYNINEFQCAYYVLFRFIQLYPSDKQKSEAKEMINKMESFGLRSIPEPIKRDGTLLFTDGQIIFCENEPGEELFFIKQGKIKIIKTNKETDIMLSILHQGEIFGELAIVSEKPRNATALSYGKSVLVPIKKESLISLMHRSPDILINIITAISHRVWFSYIRQESKLYKHPLTRLYSFLENKLLEDHISLKDAATHTFQFSIDDLLKMCGIPQDKMNALMEDLLSDENLNFNFGQIVIHDSSQISAKAKYHKSRDKLYDDSSDEETIN